MNREEADSNLRDFLSKLSKIFVGRRYEWLRLLLFDHLSIFQLSNKNKLAISFFNELLNKGAISPTDVELLLDIVKTTQYKPAIDKVEEYINRSKCESHGGSGLSNFRKKLFEAVFNLVEQDFESLKAYYQLEHYDFKNVWEVVFYLSKEHLLKCEEKNMIRFADCINKEARYKLKDFLPLVEEVEVARKKLETASSISRPMEYRSPEYKLTELNDELFRELLVDMSKYWDKHGSLSMLKVIICEFQVIPIANIEKQSNSSDLFCLLRGPGLLSHGNINVLIECFNLSGLHGVKTVIDKYVPSFKGFKVQVQHFSKHRQNLIKFGRLLNADKIRIIVKLYDLHVEPADPWELILKLENENILKAEKLDPFIEKLRRHNMEQEANAFSKTS